MNAEIGQSSTEDIYDRCEHSCLKRRDHDGDHFYGYDGRTPMAYKHAKLADAVSEGRAIVVEKEECDVCRDGEVMAPISGPDPHNTVGAAPCPTCGGTGCGGTGYVWPEWALVGMHPPVGVPLSDRGKEVAATRLDRLAAAQKEAQS